MVNFFALKAQDQTCACCSEQHQQFDFWLGTWRVTTPDGTYAGTNTILKEESNCVLKEKWISATAGYTGTSINYYDSTLKQWVQLWVDNQGQSLYMRGELVHGAMILESELMRAADGILRYNRVTWTPNADGSVRQHWQTSTDKETWQSVFDGLYQKIKD